MFGILTRLLFALAVLYFFGRLLRAVLGSPQRVRSSRRTEAAPTMVRDPICGMYLDARLAVRVEQNRQPLYFCSKECREKYLAASD